MTSTRPPEPGQARRKEALELDQTLDRILGKLREVVPCACASILLLREDRLQVVAANGSADSAQVIGRSVSAAAPVLARLLRDQGPVILDNPQELKQIPTWSGLAQVGAWMAVPMFNRGHSLGLLVLEGDSNTPFAQGQATVAEAFAAQAAAALESARLALELSRSRTRLHQQQQRLQQIMEQLPNAVLLLDQDQALVFANESAQRLLGRLVDTPLDKPIARVGNKPLETLLDASSATKRWLDLQSADGNSHFEATARGLGQAGEHAHWLLLIRDVTDRRRQEQYLRSQEQLATVGRLASGIAHDFNNIMAIVALYTQLVSRSPALTDKDRMRLNTIQEQSKQASALIHQILDFSRQSTVEQKTVDLASFLKELAKLLERILPANVRLVLSIDEGEFLLRAEPTRLQQLIMNLAVNARDAMPSGGALEVSLSRLVLSPTSALPLPGMVAGHWLRLAVADGGVGIPAEELSRIFEPQYAAGGPGEGVGLGLALVYGIVEQHNGFIDAASSHGEGTTFTVYLPALAPGPAAARAVEPLTGAGEHILVVEDDRQTREALAEIIRLLNYEVTTAENGEQALALFEETGSGIDLVISDMVMPNMGGADLYGAIMARNKMVKMILLTGYPLDGNGNELLQQGIVSYVQKPLRVHQIAEAIHVALHGQP